MRLPLLSERKEQEWARLSRTGLLDGSARTPVDAHVCEVFHELHGPQQVTRLEQGLKSRVELMVKSDGALSKGTQLFLGKQGTKEASVPDNSQ